MWLQGHTQSVGNGQVAQGHAIGTLRLKRHFIAVDHSVIDDLTKAAGLPGLAPHACAVDEAPESRVIPSFLGEVKGNNHIYDKNIIELINGENL